MIDTPLRGAALGMTLVALVILILSLSDRVLRVFDRRTDRAGRDARRARFRSYTLMLVSFAIGMVLISELVGDLT